MESVSLVTVAEGGYKPPPRGKLQEPDRPKPSRAALAHLERIRKSLAKEKAEAEKKEKQRRNEMESVSLVTVAEGGYKPRPSGKVRKGSIPDHAPPAMEAYLKRIRKRLANKKDEDRRRAEMLERVGEKIRRQKQAGRE